MSSEIHEREIAFHDEWAASVDPGSLDVRAAFEHPTAVENRFILERMGPLSGKRLLDVGAGLGESSVYFALLGAQVTTSDISEGMVQFAVELGRRHGVALEGVVSAGENLELKEGSYDFVYAANTLHHVTDRARLVNQFHRALRTGGRFFTWDPIAYNPFIKIYRLLAARVRTEDEAPLTSNDLRLVRERFPDAQHREFWILTQALFLKYYFVDRVDPNNERYWKRIYKEGAEDLRWWEPLLRADEVITRWPVVRWLAWNMVMWGSKVAS